MDSRWQPPEFFFFDLGNVLVSFDMSVACRQIGTLTGRPAEQIHELIFAGDLQRRYELGQVTERQFYEAFCRGSGTSPDCDAFLAAGADIFALNRPIVELVDRLHNAGRNLGILSNTCASHWRHLTRGDFAALPALFPTTVLSFQEGYAKPSAEIYTRAAQRIGVDPRRIFFVDDRSENVAGAQQCGWDAVLFVDADQLAQDLQRRGGW